MRPIVLCFLTLSFFVCSCKKKEAVLIYIPDDLKAYSVFYPGSGWKYLNETTGTYDTTWVRSNPTFSFYSIGEDVREKTEQCVMSYQGPLMGLADIDPYGYGLKFSGLYGIAICSHSYAPGIVYGALPSGTLTNIAQLDSLKVNNHVFHDVLVTQSQDILTMKGTSPSKINEDTLTITFYFVKKVGLIKIIHRQNSADTCWSLVDYKTVVKL
jgi:hypothetical protein